MTETGKSSLESFLKKPQEQPVAQEVPVVAAAPTETKVESVKDTKPTEVKDQRKAEEPTVLDNWDKEAKATESPEVPTITEPYYAPLAKKVGIEFKDEDEIVAKLKADPFEGVPVNLKKAIEFAKQGGDYLQLLKVSHVDYSKFESKDLYEADVLSKASDKVAAKEWLDSVSPIQKEIEGSRLKQNLMYQQQIQEQELARGLESQRQAAESTRTKATQALQEALNKTEAIDVAGFKLKLDARHKKAVATSIQSSEFWSDPRYQTSNGYDFNKKIRDEFLLSNWETVQGFLTDRVKSTTLKEVANEVQNVELEKNLGREQVDQKPTPLYKQLNDQTRGVGKK